MNGTNSACSYIAVYLLSIDPSIVGEVLSQVLIRDYVFVRLLPNASEQTLKEMK